MFFGGGVSPSVCMFVACSLQHMSGEEWQGTGSTETTSHYEVECVPVINWLKNSFWTSVNDFAKVYWGQKGVSFTVTTEAALCFA